MIGWDMSEFFLLRRDSAVYMNSENIEIFYSKEDLLSFLETLETFEWCEIAEISSTMSHPRSRKEALEWKRPIRGGITW